jgi:hypothetical protein
MGETVVPVEVTKINDPIPPGMIREELDRILQSEDFRSSKRSQEFLTYVVEQTLNGSTDALKERTIAIDVFHRPPGYDPGEDATVRVRAGEVRKRLLSYYATTGVANPIRIELPSGSYVPGFRRMSAPSPPIQLETRTPESAPTPQRPRWRPVWLVAAAVLLAGVSAVLLTSRVRQNTSVLSRFWAPVFKDNGAVALCVAYVPVYGLDREPTSAAPATADEFVLLKDQFVGSGDLIASMRLSSLLTKQNRAYVLKVGNDVSFHDLRTGPAVLIGYSYTRWKEISSQMRYFIDTAKNPVGITDNGKPTAWVLPDLPNDRKTDRDFAIVSRVFHQDTHAMLVELAGVTSYGTEAAGDLVTNADLMAEALRGAPKGWQEMNMQLVLSVKVIGGTPTSPKVIGSYFW